MRPAHANNAGGSPPHRRGDPKSCRLCCGADAAAAMVRTMILSMKQRMPPLRQEGDTDFGRRDWTALGARIRRTAFVAASIHLATSRNRLTSETSAADQSAWIDAMGLEPETDGSR